MGVLVGDKLIEPDGRLRVIPPSARDSRFGVLGVVRAGEELLVSDPLSFEGTNGVDLVEGRTTTELGPCVSGTGVSSPDNRAAWITFSCPESNDPAPTTMVVRAAGGTTTSTDLTLPPNENVLSSAAGLLGDLVVVNRANKVLWHSPGLADFSPSGEQVAGGLGGRVTIYDTRSGQEVATVALPDGVRLVGEPVWEDDQHLLAVAKDDAGRSVVLLGLDGAMERAGAPLPDRAQVLLVP